MLAVALMGGYFLLQGRGSAEPSFCHPAMPIRVIGDRTVALETEGTSGGTCPVPRTNEGMETLGTDCKVRDEHGNVVATVTTLGNGTC
ncbi:MAG TPA: hypothetical protein VFN21_08915 [Acidimicrobiales bacterium]|nr:hypothetical protein [Acidimicrobiales bacterium]